MGKKKGEKGGAGEPDRPGFLDSMQARAEASEESGGSGFNPLTILLIGGVFLIMINQSLRDQVGEYAGYVLEPAIGFGGQDPALTLLLASIITGISTGVIRHIMVDWVDMARVQAKMKAFQSELKEARKNENNYKVKKLTELQPELMKEQAGMSGQQFKPMGYTMVIVIPMFAWLWQFMQGLQADLLARPECVDAAVQGCRLTINAPWGTGATALLESAPVVSFLPTWILIYSLFSIPIGQLVQKGLKAYEFSGKLESGHELEVA